MDYGKAMRLARAARGMSQKEVATAAGLDASHISLIESGRRQPSLAALEQVSSALRIPLYLLMLLGAEESDLRGISSGMAAELGSHLLDLLLSSDPSSANSKRSGSSGLPPKA